MVISSNKSRKEYGKEAFEQYDRKKDEYLNPPKIKYVHIYVTRRCNIKCSHCFTDSCQTMEHEMSAAEWVKIASDIGHLGVKTVHIEGGEPLIYPGIEDVVVSFVKSKVTDILLVTNGLSASQQRLETLRDCGLKRIAVSFDSTNPDIHNELRDGSHQYAKNAIITAVKLGITTRISSVLTKKSVHGLKELIDFAVYNGVSTLNIDWFNGVGRGKTLTSLYQIKRTDKDLFRLLESAIIHFLKKGKTGMTLAVDLPGWLKPEDSFLANDSSKTHILECDAVKSQISVGPDGSVYPCFIYSHGNGSLGNLRYQTLHDILKSNTDCVEINCPIGATSHKFYYCE